ncbi:MAG: hypothetical protein Q9175_007450 [Cornicularia normoerica]
MKNEYISYYRYDPVEVTIVAAAVAKAGRGCPRIVLIEELVFTGYEGFASEEDKAHVLEKAEEVSLDGKFTETYVTIMVISLRQIYPINSSPFKPEALFMVGLSFTEDPELAHNVVQNQEALRTTTEDETRLIRDEKISL